VKAKVQTVIEAFQHIPQPPEQDQVETDSSDSSSSNEATEQSAWILESGEDITKLFSNYFNMAKQIMGHEKNVMHRNSRAENRMFESYFGPKTPPTQLSHVESLFRKMLKAIHQQQLNRSIDSAIDFTMEEHVKIATEINKLTCLSNSLVIATEVIKLAVSLLYEKQRVLSRSIDYIVMYGFYG
jgi:hypothetical protein